MTLRFMKRLPILAMPIIALMLISVFPQRARADIELTDILGRSVTLSAPAQRVLLGFYFEDFFAIVGPKAYDRVVAISRTAWRGWRNSQWKTYVAAAPRIAELTDVGEADAGTFSVEKALAAEPDVVILADWQYRTIGEGIKQIEAAGIPVVVVDYNAQTVEKHVASTLILGKVMGTEARAKTLADEYAAAVHEIKERIAKLGRPKPKVYVELGHKGAGEFDASYGDTMWGRLIEQAGGRNLAKGKIANRGALNPEYVLASDPDAIFIAGSYWINSEKAVVMGFGVDETLTRARLKPYTARPGWPNLKAVKNGQIHALYHGGVRTLYDYAFLQYMAKTLYPDAFADLDPHATHRRFYEKYLPIAAEGVFMSALR